MSKAIPVIVLFVFSCLVLSAQTVLNQVINATEVERIEKVLSADDMEGRATFSKGIDKAADFIAAEFKKAGLQPIDGQSYFQSFSMIKGTIEKASATLDGKAVEEDKIALLSKDKKVVITEKDNYEKVVLDGDQNPFEVLNELQNKPGNYLVLISSNWERQFNFFKRPRSVFAPKGNIVMILTDESPSTYKVSITQTVETSPLKNVVGILPGKSRKNEYVIFSGHYDHLGIRKPNEKGDSIYNGANDDAAGTTAVMMLAHYFAQVHNNERTLIFAAFTAEEIGGYGSRYFSQQFDPAQVMAMFNIEMIGTESKWGTNSAYITGYEKTDMGKILAKNLEGTGFEFHPDPYTKQNLFYRSDNATLARLGVPAHTISTSKMDNEPYYHTAGDEIGTLDMKNMAEIIKAIAISSTSIIKGDDTPSRVDTSTLR